MQLSTLIATVLRELRAAGLFEVVKDVSHADDLSKLRSRADLRRLVGRWSEHLSPETRGALEKK